MRKVPAAVGVSLGLLLAARGGWADEASNQADRAAADALFHEGEADEAQLRFDAALQAYTACYQRAPSSRYAGRAAARASDLRAHSEGGFAPLAELETIRRSPEKSNDPAALDTLLRDADHFPPGRVRGEARMLVAEAYRGRLQRPRDAPALLEQVASDPSAEVLLARQAASELVATDEANGDLDLALAATVAHRKLLPEATVKSVQRQRRRGPLRVVAMVDLLCVGLFAIAALLGKAREDAWKAVRRVAPLALVFAGFAAGAGGLLASRYETTSPIPFVMILPASFVIALAGRAWSAAGSTRPVVRALRAFACFAGVFAAAFLTLDRMDPVYLQGFGL